MWLLTEFFGLTLLSRTMLGPGFGSSKENYLLCLFSPQLILSIIFWYTSICWSFRSYGVFLCKFGERLLCDECLCRSGGYYVWDSPDSLGNLISFSFNFGLLLDFAISRSSGVIVSPSRSKFNFEFVLSFDFRMPRGSFENVVVLFYSSILAYFYFPRLL